MNATDTVKRIISGALLAFGVALAGFGLAAVPAQAGPGFVPLDAWPGCPNDHPQGPCHWCPGQPLPPTGNHVTNPERWDNNICHTYYYVYFGQGNVAKTFGPEITHRRRHRRFPLNPDGWALPLPLCARSCEYADASREGLNQEAPERR